MSTPRHQERKVVTAAFCDLAGFRSTQLSCARGSMAADLLGRVGEVTLQADVREVPLAEAEALLPSFA